MDDYVALMNQFPAVFAAAPVLLFPSVPFEAPLVAYLHVGESDVHGHYIGPTEEIPLAHKHKGGQRAHEHCPVRGA
jgi:hypothetical protein